MNRLRLGVLVVLAILAGCTMPTAREEYAGPYWSSNPAVSSNGAAVITGVWTDRWYFVVQEKVVAAEVGAPCTVLTLGNGTKYLRIRGGRGLKIDRSRQLFPN